LIDQELDILEIEGARNESLAPIPAIPCVFVDDMWSNSWREETQRQWQNL